MIVLALNHYLSQNSWLLVPELSVPGLIVPELSVPGSMSNVLSVERLGIPGLGVLVLGARDWVSKD